MSGRANTRQTQRDAAAESLDGEIEFGREVCGTLEEAERREWLVTNGVGGYASGTVHGGMSRKYHGLLVAALQPPVGRTQLVAGVDEVASYEGETYALATHRWASGAVDPKGYRYIESFRLEGTTPVWTYALADTLLEKRVWMRQGQNTTFVQYVLIRASGPVHLDCKVLVNYRDFHSTTHAGSWQMRVEPVTAGVKVTAFEGAVPYYLKSMDASCEPHHEWHIDCFLPAERERGLDDRDDHLFATRFRKSLENGQSITLLFSTRDDVRTGPQDARTEQLTRETDLLAHWEAMKPRSQRVETTWVRRLVLAADQFIVKRALPDEPDGRSVIAGYHWFGDWGRDTMIALPGITLAVGRPEVARQILLSFSRYVDQGMLPNNFPDAGGKPEYNTVDAALWYFEALRQYLEATKDAAILQSLYRVLAGIIDAHVKGTRFNIRVDPEDGLVYAGGPGAQLTWMDAKVGDWVVTPRTGKPVEINALWINALETMAAFANATDNSSDAYEKLAAKAKRSFQKFWNAERDCCFDVIDSPGLGNDASLRPNQIFAVSLASSPLKLDQQRSIVEVCARRLLTSFGLRSLAVGESGYAGHYGGGPRERDAAYHQGTVWGWLLGPFALAHYKIYKDQGAALRFLEPLGRHINAHGLGTLSEIFDGDAPFAPNGCIAQAWTVGEVLRAWQTLQG